MTTKILICSMCVILSTVSLSFAKEWRGIVPLHSKRADVERVLGSPTKPHGSIYRTEYGNVFVWYSDEPCKKDVSELWNVPPDTVLSVTVYPKTKQRIVELNLEESKYRKEANTHIQGITYLVNDEEGIRIETAEGMANSITYLPTSSDSHLRCPGFSTRHTSEDEKRDINRKVDDRSPRLRCKP